MAKHKYAFIGKFFSELNAGKLTWGERVIEADNYIINAIGALTFYLVDGNTARNVESLPPGFWIFVGEIDEEHPVTNNGNIQITD